MRRLRSWRVAGPLLAVALLVAGWLVICVQVVADPRTQRPADVDAVVVLGPPDVDDRLTTAEQLIADGDARTIVVSVNNRYQKQAVRFCRAAHPGVTVLCFTPQPGTTRGEAEHVRDLVAARHWTRLAVVTSTYHISRARMIFGRCFHGTLLMIPSGSGPSVRGWIYQFGYQTAGWIKAQFLRSC